MSKVEGGGRDRDRDRGSVAAAVAVAVGILRYGWRSISSKEGWVLRFAMEGKGYRLGTVDCLSVALS